MITISNKRRPTRWLIAGALSAALLSVGCQQKMANQPSFKPLEPCTFFDDGSSARPLVPGTVARGNLRADTTFYTGRLQVAPAEGAAGNSKRGARAATSPPAAGTPVSAAPRQARAAREFAEETGFVEEIPIPVNPSVITHGYHRYMIYCVVCHDPLGTGHGRIIERGYTAPPSYHIDRLRTAPVGRLFAVISEGYGSMPSYGSQIPPEDRWAIVAYLRTLQLSQHYPVDKLTPEMRTALARATARAGPDAERIPAAKGDVP